MRLSYLLIELYYIAILLKFRFIAADDLDDLLNLPQCWLRGVWLRSALCSSANAGIAARAEMARTSLNVMIGFPDYAQALLVMFASYDTLPAVQSRNAAL